MNGTYLNSPKVSPKVTPSSPPARPIHWTVIGVASIAAGTIISLVDIIRQPLSRPAAVIKSDELIQRPGRPVNPRRATPSEPVVPPAPSPVPTPALVVQPAPRAELVEPRVRRGLPVEGQLYLVQMDERNILIRFMGSVRDFDALPKQPNLYDYYQVASSGHAWIFMQPAGFSAPAWVDP